MFIKRARGNEKGKCGVNKENAFMSCLYMWGVCYVTRRPKGERQKERRFFKTFSKLRWGSGEAQERKAKEIVDLAYG